MAVFGALKKLKVLPYYYLIIGVVHSILNTLILLLINHLLLDGPSTMFGIADWMVFSMAIVISFLSSNYLQVYLMKETKNILYQFEITFLQKLRNASYEGLQKLGKHKVYTALEDANVIGEAPEIITSVFNAIIVTVCCIGFILYVSFVSGLFVVLAMVLLFILYSRRMRGIEKVLNHLRDLHNDFYTYLNDLLGGFKEIKMSKKRNDTLFEEYLKANKVESHFVEIKARKRDIQNELTGNFSWYLVIGLIMYALPVTFSLTPEVRISLLMAVLFMMRPISVLVGSFYDYSRIKIAFERLNEFEKQVEEIPSLTTRSVSDVVGLGKFESMRFENLSYEYVDNGSNERFAFGPLNLTISAGDILFITGGNGSGKSTFINLLTGLYKPMDGAIYYNGRKVTDEWHSAFISEISAVFCNYHLFAENYDKFDLSDSNVNLSDYLELMRLTRIKRVGNRIDNTALSKGQQKRVALIYSLLEERQILVLDEWAAEQDPEFRNYFYNHLLKNLKDRGKTVIAVTHDNQYFDKADKIITFDYGNIVHAS